MANQKSFKEGDLVRKKRGTKAAVITQNCGSWVYIRYVDSGATSDAYVSDLVHIEDTEPERDITASLFSFTEDGKDQYARLIGKDEQGRYVLEVRGAGIVVKPVSEVKEVLPYTIEVEYFGNSNGIHYEVPKGQIGKGDVVINSNGNIGVVSSLDTKRTKARDGSGLRALKTRPVLA